MLVSICKQFKRMPRRKAVDSCWQLSLDYSRTNRDSDPYIFYSRVRILIAHKLAGQRAPATFSVSRAWMLDHRNGKESCA